jgi:hypothetical protein
MGFEREAFCVDLLRKNAAGRPIPINRAEVDDIVEELLEKFRAKILAYSFSPLDVLGVVAGRVGLSSDFAEKLTVETTRTKKDILGREFTIKYLILPTDNPRLPAGATGWKEKVEDSQGPDAPHTLHAAEKVVALGFGPNPGLQSAVLKNIRDFESSGRSLEQIRGDILEEMKFFADSIRPYITEVLRHEEVHVVDVVKKPEEERLYKIDKPEGESLMDIAKKLEVSARSLFSANMALIVESGLVRYGQLAMLQAITAMMSGDSRYIEELYLKVRFEKLKQRTELNVPPKAASQIMPKKRDTLKTIAKRIGVDPIRLLVVNFNHLFARVLANRPAESYQEIYEFSDSNKEGLINLELDPDDEIKLVPSYRELYAYDRGFYLLTREEGKAHYEQIIFQIEKELRDKGINPQERDISFEKMLSLSSVVGEYQEHLAPRPVDKLIKTPLYGKTLERLKSERSKDFIDRMYFHWNENIKRKKNNRENL